MESVSMKLILLIFGAVGLSQAGVPGGAYVDGPGVHGGGYTQDYRALPYQFNYGVNDQKSGAQFGRWEKSDGQNVNGAYRVGLPDGRTQVVNYIADGQHGFKADVKYEGEARYDHGAYGHGLGHGHGHGHPGPAGVPAAAVGDKGPWRA